MDFCVNCTLYITYTNENRPLLDFWKHCHLKRVYCKIKIFFNMEKGCNICQNGKKSAKIKLYFTACLAQLCTRAQHQLIEQNLIRVETSKHKSEVCQ